MVVVERSTGQRRHWTGVAENHPTALMTLLRHPLAAAALGVL
jgi:hypothetical protein